MGSLWFTGHILFYLLFRGSGVSHPFLGNGAGAHEIGKISDVLTKIRKIYIVFMYEVFIARLIPMVNHYLVSGYVI